MVEDLGRSKVHSLRGMRPVYAEVSGRLQVSFSLRLSYPHNKGFRIDVLKKLLRDIEQALSN
jgi:hypothetical protein